MCTWKKRNKGRGQGKAWGRKRSGGEIVWSGGKCDCVSSLNNYSCLQKQVNIFLSGHLSYCKICSQLPSGLNSGPSKDTFAHAQLIMWKTLAGVVSSEPFLFLSYSSNVHMGWPMSNRPPILSPVIQNSLFMSSVKHSLGLLQMALETSLPLLTAPPQLVEFGRLHTIHWL